MLGDYGRGRYDRERAKLLHEQPGIPNLRRFGSGPPVDGCLHEEESAMRSSR